MFQYSLLLKYSVYYINKIIYKCYYIIKIYLKSHHLFVVTLCKLSILLQTKGMSFQIKTQKYWVGQKVCSGFSVRSYRKTQILANPTLYDPHNQILSTYL